MLPPFSPGEDQSVRMCSRQISPLTIWYPECTPAEMWVTPAWDSNLGCFSPSVLFSLHVARGSSRWHCAAVCENVAGNTDAALLSLWLLDPLLCSEGHLNASFHSPAILLSFFLSFFLVIFVFHSQLCSDKMALRSVSRSITDKARLRGNFQPDQLGLS